MINYYSYEFKISERILSLKDSFKMWAMLICSDNDADSGYVRKSKRKPFRY
jgi:hypothetical protein